MPDVPRLRRAEGRVGTLFGLAAWAVEQVSAFIGLHEDFCAAHVAGLAGPAVDVHFSPVVIFSGWAAHSYRSVLRGDGINLSAFDADLHQVNEIVPQLSPECGVNLTPGPEGVNVVAEKHFGAVDVADAGKKLLVHQERGNSFVAPLRACQNPGRILAGDEGVCAELCHRFVVFGWCDDPAPLGATQVGCDLRGGDPESNLAVHVDGVFESESANQPEVNVDDRPRSVTILPGFQLDCFSFSLRGKVQKQLFPPGFRFGESEALERACIEASLG